MEAAALRRVYVFGEFRLDAAQRLLSKRDTREVVSVTPRAFDTLLYLIEHAGELVDKATLLSAVWPNLVVEEGNLTQAISTLRRALGESPGEHRYIATDPGRGYRFVAVVERETAAVKPHRWTAFAKWGLAAALVVATAGLLLLQDESSAPPARLVSIAIPPFENQTGDGGQDYFARGMSDELVELLIGAGNLRVTALDDGPELLARARASGATHLLEGSVKRADDRLRIHVRLVDVGSGDSKWAETFDKKMDDLFAVQDEIAIRITHSLVASIGGNVFGSRSPPTRDITAFRLWLKGRQAFQAPTEANLRHAVELLEDATRRDPQFAKAWTLLAIAYARVLTQHIEVDDALRKFELASNEAVRLQPNSAAARLAHATLDLSRGRWVDGERGISAAMVAEPAADLSESLATQVYMQVGKLDRAIEILEGTHHQRPEEVSILMSLSILNSLDGRDDAAVDSARQAIALGYPEDVLPMPVIFSEAARRAGRYEDAITLMVKSLPGELRAVGAGDDVRAIYGALQDPTKKTAGLAALRRWEGRLVADRYVNFRARAHAIVWYSQLGAVDDAYRVANDWLRQYQRTGFVGLPFVGVTLWQHDIAAFRADPRFQSLLEAFGLIEYFRLNGPPDGCEMREGVLGCRT